MRRNSAKSTNNRNKRNYDAILFNSKKGSKEKLKKYADMKEMSLSSFVVLAINEKLEREGLEPLETLQVNEYYINSKFGNNSESETETDSETETNQD